MPKVDESQLGTRVEGSEMHVKAMYAYATEHERRWLPVSAC